jgi:hypothetical protein
MSFKKLLPALACALLLSACAGGAGPRASHDPAPGPLTPMPGEFGHSQNLVRDPDNGKFMQAAQAYIAAAHGPAFSQYQFTRVDLDGDGRRDGIILLQSPHSSWCNFNGCRMAVFRATDTDFKLVAQIGPVRGPLLVADQKTNGWRDIIVRVSGRYDIATKDVALRFDGRTYPSLPDYQPQVFASNEGGISIFP